MTATSPEELEPGLSSDHTHPQPAPRYSSPALADDLNTLHVLLENIPDRIYFKDSQSRFVRVSKSFCDFHHATYEDILGGSDADLFAPEHAGLALKDEQEIIRTGAPIIGKLEKETHPDGRVTWAMSSKMPWRDTQGRIVGTFGISRDVTAVKEAEAKLETAHKRLLEASRFAGMAEVASNVLHNVGNALNSINVSCTLAIQSLKEWNLDKLAKIPPLLAAHAGQLDEFLTRDPRGRQIPDYLSLVARAFGDQKTSWMTELDQLRKHVEHVNQIVAMQQSYAKVMGVVETVAPAQLVEDAIQINAAALDRHGINLVREFEPAPSVLVDKHKVLQILINLLRNAKYAVTDKAGGEEKRVAIRVGPLGEDRIRIQVVDNGVGIPPENLTRIFLHGFTTRKEGHGFGLHSGALAAHEMGGELSAHSDGVGKGAIFTLTLPIKGPSQI